MQKKKGFTLIELLVVISIIALLLSILMPALTKVKEQAKFVVGANNIRQTVLAQMMYTTENEEYFSDAMDCFGLSVNSSVAAGVTPPISNNWWCRWHNKDENNRARPELAGQLWQYLENQDIVMCPTYKSLAMVEGADHNNHNPAVEMVPQYAFSQNVFLGPLDQFNDGAYLIQIPDLSSYIAPKVSHLRTPSRVFVFAEENFVPIKPTEGYNFYWADDSLNDTGLFPWWGSPSISADGVLTNPCDSVGSLHKTSRETIEGREKGVSHAVFADGHFDVMHPWETGKYGSPKIKIKDSLH